MRKITLLLVVTFIVAGFALAADQPATATASICAAVKDRACEGGGDKFAANIGQVYCFSEIKGGKDKVVHVWFFGDKQVASIDLPIKAERWRTWSAKKIMPGQNGDWKVEVRDAEGMVLTTATFKVE